MKKIINPWLHKEGYDCFGCAPENPLGLKMDFFEDGNEIISFWRPQAHYQGWVGMLHGGILATLLDETAGWVVSRKLQTTGVTSHLEVNYRRPVKADDSQITVRARIKEQKRNIVFITCSLENDEGETCVEAEAVYYTFDEEKAREMGFTSCDVENEQLFSM
ncbi:MAG: PaaI family thioesterase [Hoylesella saccharolytica]